MNFDAKSGEVFTEIDGVVVKHFLFSNKRWYVTWGRRSSLTDKYEKERMFRSHFVYMEKNNICKIENGFEIHHIDLTKQNDKIENLEKLTFLEHKRAHLGEDWVAPRLHVKGQKGRAVGFRHEEKTILKMSSSSSREKNSQFRSDIDSQAVIDFYDDCKNLKMTANHFNCSVSAVRSRINGKVKTSDWKNISDDDLRLKFRLLGSNLTNLANEINAPESSLWRKMKEILNEE